MTRSLGDRCLLTENKIFSIDFLKWWITPERLRIYILTTHIFFKNASVGQERQIFVLSHFYTCLAHPKLQQCFITTKILKIKFVAQLLAKQKEKHKLYLCWANGFGSWLLFGSQLWCLNKVSADSMQDLAKVKQINWLTTHPSKERVCQSRVFCIVMALIALTSPCLIWKT
jgi:hypothetical protein